MFLGVCIEEVKVGTALLDVVGFRSPLVGIKSEQIHALIAWPTTVEFGRNHTEIRRATPHDNVGKCAVDIVLCEYPQLFEFLVGAASFAPPEPSTVVFVPRAENERNGIALAVF